VSGLNLVIVTPRGRVLAEGGVQKVVVRRFEERFELGGQVIFLPMHGSETVHLGEGPLLYVDALGQEKSVELGGGFAEIEQGVVTVLAPSAGVPGPSGP
jgi:F0F1-type ATP synthase epsilon subunit